MTAARHVGALHITAMPSRIHHAGAVVLTHHPAPTMDPMLDVHAVAVDGAHRSVSADARRSSTLQADVPRPCRLARAAPAIACCRVPVARCRVRMARSRVPATRCRVPMARSRVRMACRRAPMARRCVRVACRCVRMARRRVPATRSRAPMARCRVPVARRCVAMARRRVPARRRGTMSLRCRARRCRMRRRTRMLCWRRLRSRCACLLLAPGKSWNHRQKQKHYPLLQPIFIFQNAIHYRLLSTRTC